MKKVLTSLIIVTVLAIASSAMAQEIKVKVPSLLCIDMDNYPDKHQLVLKSTGSVYDPAAKVKTYTISGRDRYGVISGSGYVLPGTTILYANYSGMHLLDEDIGDFEPPIPQNSTYRLVINLTKTDKAGVIDFTFVTPDLLGEESVGLASFGNCSLVDIIQCDSLDASFLPIVPGTAAADGGQKLNECPR